MIIPSYCIGNWNCNCNNLSNPSDTELDNDDEIAFIDDDDDDDWIEVLGLFPKTVWLFSLSLLLEIIGDLNCLDIDDDDDDDDSPWWWW